MAARQGPDKPLMPRILSNLKYGSYQSMQKPKGYANKDQAVTPFTKRPLDELITAMRKGTDMMKHGRAGKPKMHYFRLAENEKDLTWKSSKGHTRSVPLWTVTQVIPGQTTDSFKRYPNSSFVPLSFSLIYKAKADGDIRTLDLTANNKIDYEFWFCGLQALAQHWNPEFSGPTLQASDSISQAALRSISPQSGAVGMPMGGIESPGMAMKGAQLSGSKPLPPVNNTSRSADGIGGGTAQGRVAGAIGLPVLQEQPGDLYQWGTIRSSQPSFGGKARHIEPSPQCIPGINHLDVLEVAVGLGHAALLARNGEMYTWGEGRCGKLGQGHQQDTDDPDKVHTLWGQPVRHICASDSVTAALTVEGQVLMAGELYTGGSGQFSHQLIPRPILGPLMDRVVVQVSCGPFHTGAVTSNGALFTWGDGLCGKLGHNNTKSYSSPQQVESLRDQAVRRVACGAWHTAAIASPLPDGADSLHGLSFIERIAIQHKWAAMYELTEEDSGFLYTWGGMSDTPNTDSLDTNIPPKMPKNHHRGFLGLGDNQGRLLPTLVGGALSGVGVRSIAVGLTFTVAVTLEGQVFQMGTTTASARNVPWDNCSSPYQVLGRLSGHFVDSISAGRYHIAALAGPLNQSTGKAHEGLESTMIFVWGKGEDGQLGLGRCKDSSMPQLVEELNGRKIVQVACGGDQTMVVCLHDPGADDTEERRKGYKQKMKQWFNPQRLIVEIPSKDGNEPSSDRSLSGRNSQTPQLQHFSPDPKNMKRSASGIGGMIMSKSVPLAKRRASLQTEPSAGSNSSHDIKRGSIGATLSTFQESPNLAREESSDYDSSKVNSLTPSAQASTRAALNSMQKMDSPGEAITEQQAGSREDYVKQLESKIEHLNALLRDKQTQTQASSPISQEARPTIVDLNAPGLDMRTPLNNSFTSANLVQSASTGNRRTTLTALSKRPNRISTLRGDQHAAYSGNENETQSLARQKVALLTQIEEIEKRQQAISEGLEENEASNLVSTNLPQMTSRPNTDRPSLVSFNDVVLDDSWTARRPSTRYKGHRRSKSGSSMSFKSSPGVVQEESAESSSNVKEPNSSQPPGQEQNVSKERQQNTIEVDKGVYLVVEEGQNGMCFGKRITFSKNIFTSESADAWLKKNKKSMYQKYMVQGTMKGTKSRTLTMKTLNALQNSGLQNPEGQNLGSYETLDTPQSASILSSTTLPASFFSPQASVQGMEPISGKDQTQEELAQTVAKALKIPALKLENSESEPSTTPSNNNAQSSSSPGTFSRAWLNPRNGRVEPSKENPLVTQDVFATPRSDFSPSNTVSPFSPSSQTTLLTSQEFPDRRKEEVKQNGAHLQTSNSRQRKIEPQIGSGMTLPSPPSHPIDISPGSPYSFSSSNGKRLSESESLPDKPMLNTIYSSPVNTQALNTIYSSPINTLERPDEVQEYGKTEQQEIGTGGPDIDEKAEYMPPSTKVKEKSLGIHVSGHKLNSNNQAKVLGNIVPVGELPPLSSQQPRYGRRPKI